jgi:hypothetical protein
MAGNLSDDLDAVLKPIFDAQWRLVFHVKQQAAAEWIIVSTMFDKTLARLCSEPKDRVYALTAVLDMGYSSPGVLYMNFTNSTLPRPDYQKPLRQVYIECATYILGVQKELEFVKLAIMSASELAGSRPTCDLDLPSWVPDLERLSKQTRLSRATDPLFHSISSSYSFSKYTMSFGHAQKAAKFLEMYYPRSIEVLRNDSVLRLTGALEGAINQVSDEIPHVDRDLWSTDPGAAVEWEIHACRAMCQFKKHCREFLWDVYSALTYGRDTPQFLDLPVELAIRRMLERPFPELEAEIRQRGDATNDPIPKYRNFIEALIIFEKCCFVMLNKDNIGIAFGAVEPGDLVVPICGLDVRNLGSPKERRATVQEEQRSYQGPATCLILRPAAGPTSSTAQPQGRTSKPWHRVLYQGFSGKEATAGNSQSNGESSSGNPKADDQPRGSKYYRLVGRAVFASVLRKRWESLTVTTFDLV